MKKQRTGLYVAEIKNKYKDRVYTTFLLRRSYREDGKVKQETLGNLSHLPPHTIALIRGSLKGETFVPAAEQFEIVRTRFHGHVAAVRGMLRRLGLHELLDAKPSRQRDLAEALIVARAVDPHSKLATTRWWADTTLPADLGIEDATEDELYAAMDWLGERQTVIETRLAQRHLTAGDLVLYDVSSSYYEGQHCPLAAFGHNRDGKRGKKQIVYGLIVNRLGCPVAVEVFGGQTADPSTVASQVEKIKARFRLGHVVLAGDRGMLTRARIESLKQGSGLDWVTALRAKEIQQLADQGRIQLTLFDEQDLAEITAPDYPGERLIVCRNPLLAEERSRKRTELLAATEELLARLAQRVKSGQLKKKEKIGEALGRIKNRYKMGKHFVCHIDEGHFTYERREENIQREAQLDGVYVVRTSVPAEKWSAEEAVLSYKSLSQAERAFRTLKSIDLQVRPIYHRLTERVQSHIFLCMLAYYVQWHLRQAWKPLLFDDEAPGAHREGSPVRPAVRSPAAEHKARTQQRADGTPVHSFRTLLEHLSTLARNDVRIPAKPELPTFPVLTTPTPLQRQALERAGLNLSGTPKSTQ